jgi:hypothetical protein
LPTTRRIIVAKKRNKKSPRVRIEEAILANNALMKVILEAEMSPPLTVEKFCEWLKSV